MGNRVKMGKTSTERRGLEIRIELVQALGFQGTDCARRDEHGASNQQDKRDSFHGSASQRH